MADYNKNPFINSDVLPVDIVFHPSWWYKNAGITFDEDFFYHPLKRVESEKKMESILYEKFGNFGLGNDRNSDLPIIGAVHNAAGYIISEMLGCKIIYQEDAAPQVIAANRESLEFNPENAFQSNAFKRLMNLCDKLKAKYGYITGDVNWGGVLNIALDVVGEKLFMSFFEQADETKQQIRNLAGLVEKFAVGIAHETGSSSISVNRNVRNIEQPVFLHSECSHTMISTDMYEEFLMPIDVAWSKKYRPFGIHYCGKDPHRYAESFAKIETLDFLDVGWGGDVKKLREYLPDTFLNIRLDPVTINNYKCSELKATISRLVLESGNPFLTGICCINMDDKVEDSKITAIFQTVEILKQEHLS